MLGGQRIPSVRCGPAIGSATDEAAPRQTLDRRPLGRRYTDRVLKDQARIDQPFVLRNTRFSEVISEEDRGVFLRVCPERSYPAGSIVFRAGDPAHELHVIARGQVKVLVPTAEGDERILAICGPDDFVGETFVAEGAHYQSEAVALTEVVTCPISRQQFLQMALNAPGFVLGFTQILNEHLFACRVQLASGYDAIIVRVAKAMLDQVARFGKPEADGWATWDTKLKHEDMAAMVSATRVSVSMAIGELRERGLVIGSRGSYRIHVPALKAMVEDD